MYMYIECLYSTCWACICNVPDIVRNIPMKALMVTNNNRHIYKATNQIVVKEDCMYNSPCHLPCGRSSRSSETVEDATSYCLSP